MEIALLPKAGLRIKSKQVSLVVDASDKVACDGLLLVGKSPEGISSDDAVLIYGPGEYEIGGIKMTGMRAEADMLYSLNVDGIDILLGKLQALSKMQHKLKEYDIVVVLCDVIDNASFITSLASNVVVFYGEKAGEIASTFGKENLKTVNKYQVTKEKLPAEVETILLA